MNRKSLIVNLILLGFKHQYTACNQSKYTKNYVEVYIGSKKVIINSKNTNVIKTNYNYSHLSFNQALVTINNLLNSKCI